MYKCVNTSDVAELKKAAADFKKMGNLNAVKRAARQAGQYLAGQMYKMVEGESSLRDYQDVGRAFRVFEDDDNIVVGIPPHFNRLVGRAEQMDNIYQVAATAHDLAHQAGDVEDRFYEALAP